MSKTSCSADLPLQCSQTTLLQVTCEQGELLTCPHSHTQQWQNWEQQPRVLPERKCLIQNSLCNKICSPPSSSPSKWKHWHRAEGRYMNHKNSRDPSAPNFSVVLCEQVGRKGQQEMMREHTRGKVIPGCAWRCMPAEQHWSWERARLGCGRDWSVLKGLIFIIFFFSRNTWIFLSMCQRMRDTAAYSQNGHHQKVPICWENRCI